jgi:SnoaL-like domain
MTTMLWTSISRSGKDQATGEAYCMAHHVTVESGKRRLMIASLRYLYTFVKRDGSWLFAEHLLRVDHPRASPIAAAFPVLQNHLAEIRNVTSCASVQAFIPPSTVMFAPVMYEASGPTTNATVSAISSTRP